VPLKKCHTLRFSSGDFVAVSIRCSHANLYAPLLTFHGAASQLEMLWVYNLSTLWDCLALITTGIGLGAQKLALPSYPRYYKQILAASQKFRWPVRLGIMWISR